MENGRRSDKGRVPRATRLLEVDAWIDSTLYEAGFKLSETWENITIFFRRFRVYGPQRAVVEFFSEGVTLIAAGAVIMLALAMPAFEETAGDWRVQDDYAVTFLDRYGNEIGQRGIIQRDSVPVGEMPDHVVKAVLATEDRRFYEHFGIDFFGLLRAMSENVRANTIVQGGSTITQQLAKNLFLTNERTMERKIKEAFLAIWLEANLSKREILQFYLDRAYLGGGTFGIAAAADFYFDKEVKDLDLAEAAMIAGLFKAPARYAPHINLPAARARANEVLSNLVQSGFMTEGQVLSARLNPASAVDRGKHDSPDYFLDWAFEQVKEIAPDGATHSLVARTTFDPDLQHAVEESLEYHLRQYGEDYDVSQGAAVVLETNGAVRALVGGRDYGQSQFNRATRAVRQPGSSFKPYVYATAMEAGFEPGSVISDGPISWGNWSPQNYTRRYAGRVDLATALIHSYNTVPVRLARDHLGIEPIQKLTKAMGVETELNGHKTMVLGTSGMTVMDQVTAYSVFANGGFAGMRHGIRQLLTHSGKVVYDGARDTPAPHRVLSEQAVSAMNSILVQVPERGTGRRAALPLARSAGKTGTTQSYRDGWYVGYTGNYVAAVWLGNDDYHPTNRMTGGSLPAMVWQRFMAYAHRNIELKPIPGIENPLPERDETVVAATDGATGETDDLGTRTRILPPATKDVLDGLLERFRSAPALEQNGGPEAVSAL
ncbi:PBP1A family penicillin-binding protein [Chelativorans sp. M5D2P16]|uniref:transglycosylase domain-containing protein n=1 Tax=Chelativorans sp. M5D2P16 TaxID=3095678 RepID=UPI002ACA510A|nr:PBP1A family penicillin-binding protein [Chelativorans sp. M5D2P16]MDZ5698362.1 PBP1A family penicillin-binding protein [Chelativorans sp. M5D2P16]